MKLIMLTTGFIAASILFGVSCEAKSQFAIWLSVVAMAIVVATVAIYSLIGKQSQNKTAMAV